MRNVLEHGELETEGVNNLFQSNGCVRCLTTAQRGNVHPLASGPSFHSCGDLLVLRVVELNIGVRILSTLVSKASV